MRAILRKLRLHTEDRNPLVRPTVKATISRSFPLTSGTSNGMVVSEGVRQRRSSKATIYLNQDTRSRIEPLWSAILGFLRHTHVAGAILFRANAGFGTHQESTILTRSTAAEHDDEILAHGSERDHSLGADAL
jgi:hypothetical protein